MELSEATKLVNDFLDNPGKTQPRSLNKATGVWSRTYGHYVMVIKYNTPARIQMNIERLILMNTKAFGIVHILESKESVVNEQIPLAGGDTLVNAYAIALASTKMIGHLLSVSSPFRKPNTLVRNEMKVIEKTINDFLIEVFYPCTEETFKLFQKWCDESRNQMTMLVGAKTDLDLVKKEHAKYIAMYIKARGIQAIHVDMENMQSSMQNNTGRNLHASCLGLILTTLYQCSSQYALRLL